MRSTVLRSRVCPTPSTLSAVLVTATIAALLCLVPAPGASAAGGARDTGPTLRVGTYNIQSSRSLAEFKAGVAALKPLVDVMGLQEIGANEKHQSLRLDHDWGYYRPPAIQQNPVLWRRDRFDFRSAAAPVLSARVKVPHAYGHGDVTFKTNYATVVRLVERSTGERISFVNVHLVHGATWAGRPKPGRRPLFRLYKRQVGALAKVVAGEKLASDDVYVMGDFNIGYAADARWHLKKLPYHRLRGQGLTSMWRGSSYLRGSRGTHGSQLIDQVWTSRKASSSRIIGRIRHSDHRPVVATYALPTPDPAYLPTNGTVGFARPVVLACELDRPFQHPAMTFSLTGDLAHGHVDVEVVSGTAEEGRDFIVNTDGLHDNDLSRNDIAVEIIPDKNREVDKTFVLRLVNPVNTTINLGESLGIIVDDDGPLDPPIGQCDLTP